MAIQTPPLAPQLTEERPTEDVSVYQTGALLTLTVVALWALTALAVHLTTPSGIDRTELILLLTLTPLYLVLLPFYAHGSREAYPIGVVALLGLLVGFGAEVFDRVYVFSWSLYNIGVVLALLAAITGIYLSIRAIPERPPTDRRRASLTLGGLLALAVALVLVAVAGAEGVRRVTADLTLDRMETHVADLADLDDQLAYLADVGDYPAVTAGIVVGDSLVWTGAYGDAEVDTVYEIGSVTKPLVAAGALQLADAGLLDLDADINTYLPFDVRHPEYPELAITTRMLLSHQSGLGHLTDQYLGYHYGDERLDWLEEEHGETYPTIQPRPALAEFLPEYLSPTGRYSTPDAWTSFAPGTTYAYSTVGYDLAGLVIESVSGEPVGEYLTDALLGPLGMEHSGFSVHDFPDRQATSHWRLHGALSQTNQGLPLSDFTTVGGGGMVATVPDLARFVSTQFAEGTFGGTEVLSPRAVADMQRRAVTVPPGAGDINQVGYGLGLGHLNATPWDYWGHTFDMQGAIGHGGSTGASSAQMWFVNQEDGGYGIILMANVDRAKDDYYDVWFFSTWYRMQTLLMDEAQNLYLTG